jgi:diguanylate cyclase (GGDEF)-like protein
VLFIDIDHFKKVNDTNGHESGDHVLKMVGSTLARTARLFDVVGRWGGEEFVDVVVAVSHDGLVAAARRVRRLTSES